MVVGAVVTVAMGCGGIVIVDGIGVRVAGTAVFVTTATCSGESGSSDSAQVTRPISKTNIPKWRLIAYINFFNF